MSPEAATLPLQETTRSELVYLLMVNTVSLRVAHPRVCINDDADTQNDMPVIFSSSM